MGSMWTDGLHLITDGSDNNVIVVRRMFNESFKRKLANKYHAHVFFPFLKIARLRE